MFLFFFFLGFSKIILVPKPRHKTTLLRPMKTLRTCIMQVPCRWFTLVPSIKASPVREVQPVRRDSRISPQPSCTQGACRYEVATLPRVSRFFAFSPAERGKLKSGDFVLVASTAAAALTAHLKLVKREGYWMHRTSPRGALIPPTPVKVSP